MTRLWGSGSERMKGNMLFHITFEILEEIVLPEAKTMRNEWLGPQLQKVMESRRTL